jgi:ribonuclease-3
MSSTLNALQDRLNYRFNDETLLLTALTHTSYSVENDDTPSYERLEFLGDALLELGTTEIIFALMPDEREGPMTKLRASVVDVTTLGAIGRALDLGSAIRLGVGERRSGGADRDSILSDVVEAVLGAMFIDGGLDQVRGFVRRVWTPKITENLAASATTDARSQLQELLARTNREVLFRYERTGPDHDAVFTAEALVGGVVVGRGAAGSKKAAAIAASGDALSSGIDDA